MWEARPSGSTVLVTASRRLLPLERGQPRDRLSGLLKLVRDPDPRLTQHREVHRSRDEAQAVRLLVERLGTR